MVAKCELKKFTSFAERKRVTVTVEMVRLVHEAIGSNSVLAPTGE
jgi:hypothetical protein